MELSTNIIGVRRKSLYGDVSDAEAVLTAAHAWRHTSFPIPVLSGGKFLGHVVGNFKTGESTWIPPYVASAFESYDSLINALSTGKRLGRYWTKAAGNAVADCWADQWPTMGNPVHGTYTGSDRTARQHNDQDVGSINHGGNVSPSLKYLTRFSALTAAVNPRAFVLYDRVLSYNNCSITNGNQVMDNTLTAQRYIGSGEPGLRMCMTVQTGISATVSDLTQLQYTDQSGNTLQSMPTTPTVTKGNSNATAPSTTLPARVVAPSFPTAARCDTPFLPLADGDTGVRLVDNYTWSVGISGTFCLFLAYPLAILSSTVAAMAGDIEMVSGVGAMETRIFDGACLSFLTICRGSSQSLNQGWLEFVWS